MRARGSTRPVAVSRAHGHRSRPQRAGHVPRDCRSCGACRTARPGGPKRTRGPATPRCRLSGRSRGADMVRDAHYHAKRIHRARGIADLERHVGGVHAEIAARLAQRDVVRVLEVGCGYGTALLELRAHYGRCVELYGLNRKHDDGNAEILLRNASERRIFGDAPIDAADLPTIAYGDVSQALPFADDFFDLVVRQVAWLDRKSTRLNSSHTV